MELTQISEFKIQNRNLKIKTELKFRKEDIDLNFGLCFWVWRFDFCVNVNV